MSGPDLSVRPGGTDDLAAVAEVFLAARHAAVPAMPAPVHSDDAVRSYVAALQLGGGSERELWVAERVGAVVGFAIVRADWLDDLYVRPDAQADGVGSALLDVVKAVHPGGFGLWVFESNLAARGFYRRHGLVEQETTDGSDNQEGAPDVRMRWTGRSRD